MSFAARSDLLLRREFYRSQHLRSPTDLGRIILGRLKYHTEITEPYDGTGGEGSLVLYPFSVYERAIGGANICQHPDPLTQLNLCMCRRNTGIRYDDIVVFGAPDVDHGNTNWKPPAFEFATAHNQIGE